MRHNVWVIFHDAKEPIKKYLNVLLSQSERRINPPTKVKSTNTLTYAFKIFNFDDSYKTDDSDWKIFFLQNIFKIFRGDHITVFDFLDQSKIVIMYFLNPKFSKMIESLNLINYPSSIDFPNFRNFHEN